MKTAIIGAGMAGLTAACILNDAGYDVTIFDKSKGTGGRLSSRSHQDGWIDHGAPYFSLGNSEFRHFLQQQLPSDQIVIWRPDASGALRPDEHPHLIGVPRNSAITRGLLKEKHFQPSTRIARLESCADGWQLYNDGNSLLGCWQLVIVAVPAPQAAVLLHHQEALSAQISRVSMAPCWVAAIGTEQNGKRLPDIAVFEHPTVRRIVFNTAKPGRGSSPIALVQGQEKWSEEHLEESPEEVGQQLLSSFSELTGTQGQNHLLFTHRWRYALTEQALDSPFLWDPHSSLGVCGDWCLGRTVQDAWQSGADLAKRIIEQRTPG